MITLNNAQLMNSFYTNTTSAGCTIIRDITTMSPPAFEQSCRKQSISGTMIMAKAGCEEENLYFNICFWQLSGLEIHFTKMAVCAGRPRATLEVFLVPDQREREGEG